MTNQSQTQGLSKVKEDQHDEYNFNAPETSEQSQSQSGPGDRNPPIEVAQPQGPEEDPEGFIEESLLVDQDPNDTDADDEALVLDGVSREADVDVEDEAGGDEASDEEDSEIA